LQFYIIVYTTLNKLFAVFLYVINCKKSCCIRIGPRCDILCATAVSTT